MNGGCYAVGPRPLAPRHERFGVILYFDPELEIEPTYMAVYSQSWGEFQSDLDGQWYPVEYACDCFLGDDAWVKDLHKRTTDSRGAWNSHLEDHMPPAFREQIFEPMKKAVDRAMENRWNPTHPIEWELANVG